MSYTTTKLRILRFVRHGRLGKRLYAVIVAFFMLLLWYNGLSTNSKPATKSDELRDNIETEESIRARLKYLDRLPDDATTREQLAFQFPYDVHAMFPKLIWQTWKVNLEDKSFPSHFYEFQSIWDERNPEYAHTVLSDDTAQYFIEQTYKQIPSVVEAYNSMPKAILKADFFRYLITYARGGVYSDIDTYSIQPVDDWYSHEVEVRAARDYVSTPKTGRKHEMPPIGLVIGIEADPDRPDWNDWYARRIQFCQWTIQAKPGHPLLRELIAKITNITLTKKVEGKLQLSKTKEQGSEIMDWTGPGIWSDTVFDYLNDFKISLGAKNVPKVVDWRTFTGMDHPLIYSDVMVLPITSFSPGVGQMGAKHDTDPMAYVKHVFEGSWKPESDKM